MCLRLFNLYNMYMSAKNHDLSPVIILGQVFSYDLPVKPPVKRKWNLKTAVPPTGAPLGDPLVELPLSRKLLSQPKPTVSTMEMHNYMQLRENTHI